MVSPNSHRFLPPTRVRRFRRPAIARNFLLTMIAGSMWGLLALIALYLAAANSRSTTAFLACTLGIMATALLLDARTIKKSPETLFERSLFFHWLRTARGPRVGLVVWIVLCLGIGSAQLGLNFVLGGWEQAATKYGGVTQGIAAGEWWRLATGPYFHASAVHFISNTAMAIFVGPIAFALFGNRSLIVFILGNLSGAVAEATAGSPVFDIYMGISAGVFALFTMLFMAGVKHKRLLPKGVPVLFLAIATASTIGSEALSEHAASLAHVVGIAIGLIAGTSHRLVSSTAMHRQHLLRHSG